MNKFQNSQEHDIKRQHEFARKSKDTTTHWNNVTNIFNKTKGAFGALDDE